METVHTIKTGQKAVTTAGTKVALVAASTPCQRVQIKAKSTNTGLIYVGTATVASTTGYILSAGQSVSLELDDLGDIYLDSSVSAEGVSFLAEQ